VKFLQHVGGIQKFNNDSINYINRQKQCDEIIAESIKLYHKGDDQFRQHRTNIFLSNRAQDYDISKIVDRVDSDVGRCPFLAK
jgi:hypothetical protein